MLRNVCELTVVALSKIIELRQGIQKLQAKTSVATTFVGPPCSQLTILASIIPDYIIAGDKI